MKWDQASRETPPPPCHRHGEFRTLCFLPPQAPFSQLGRGGHDTVPALSSRPIQEPQAGTGESVRPHDPKGPSSTGDSIGGSWPSSQGKGDKTRLETCATCHGSPRRPAPPSKEVPTDGGEAPNILRCHLCVHKWSRKGMSQQPQRVGSSHLNLRAFPPVFSPTWKPSQAQSTCPPPQLRPLSLACWSATPAPPLTPRVSSQPHSGAQDLICDF